VATNVDEAIAAVRQQGRIRAETQIKANCQSVRGHIAVEFTSKIYEKMADFQWFGRNAGAYSTSKCGSVIVVVDFYYRRVCASVCSSLKGVDGRPV
jgi:hypothetical protein